MPGYLHDAMPAHTMTTSNPQVLRLTDWCTCVQHIYFKNMYMWEGDCGAKKGSKSMSKKQRSSSGGSVGGGGSWTAYTVSKKSWKGKSAMKTRNFSIDTIFNGGFCASFNSVNEGRSTCNDFTVEVNLDPNMFTLQKHTTSLRKKSENSSKGVPAVVEVWWKSGVPTSCLLQTYFAFSLFRSQTPCACIRCLAQPVACALWSACFVMLSPPSELCSAFLFCDFKTFAWQYHVCACAVNVQHERPCAYLACCSGKDDHPAIGYQQTAWKDMVPTCPPEWVVIH